MTINFQNVTLTRPGQEHGSLAAARLPFVQTANSASLQQAVSGLGFTAVGTDQYQHQDGSWAALNNGRIERGYQNIHFRGVPQDITQFAQIPAQQAAGTAAANVPGTITNGDNAAFSANLQASGFAQVLPNYFSHADGSWVAIVDNQPVVGYGGNRVQPNPNAAPAPAATPAAAPAAPAAASPRTPQMTADSVNAYPTITPQFEDGFVAAVQLPFLQPNNLTAERQIFTSKGFTEKAPGYFEHPDSSWVAYTSQGRIERGRGNQKFQGVPPGLSRINPTNPGPNHFGLAIADTKVAALSHDEIHADDKVLLDAGFTNVAPNVWRHADQSFVVAVDGQVKFGHQQTLLTSSPNPVGFPTIDPDLNIVQQSGALWGLSVNDAAKAKKELTDRGFSESRPGFFQSGNVWALIADKQVHVGYGQNKLASIPSPSNLPKVKSDDTHKWSAIAQTSKLKGNESDLASQLSQLGFSQAGQNFYTHPDRSWVAVESGKILRGMDGNMFSDVPKPPNPNDVRQYDQLPATTWDWWVNNNQAIAKLPIIGDTPQARQQLQGLGFQKVPNSTPERWQHLDGSYVFFTGRPNLGWQKWTLGQLPFNNRISQR